MIKHTIIDLSSLRDNITIDNYIGTWYVIDELIVNGTKYLLLEHEEYGEDTCHLLVDNEFNVLCETFDDILTSLVDNDIIRGHIDLTDNQLTYNKEEDND